MHQAAPKMLTQPDMQIPLVALHSKRHQSIFKDMSTLQRIKTFKPD
jgi:hypothetical protein